MALLKQNFKDMLKKNFVQYSERKCHEEVGGGQL
jgi:hypothetical protein